MRQGMPKSQAIHRSVTLNFVPIIITSVTTAIGFLMMNMSDSPVLRDFGNLSALGVVIACVLSVSLLPALLNLLPVRFSAKQAAKSSDIMDKLADLVVHRRNVLLPLSIVVIAGSAALIPYNKVNDESV
ncbi:RND transporter, partial [Vibrio vulnificus]